MKQPVFLRALFVLALFFLFPTISFAQENYIKGFVYEQSTGEPIVFSNVYLKGTTIGVSTDINGYFHISRIPEGKYELLVTYLGYDTISEQLTITPKTQIDRKFYMKEAAMNLETVNVTAERIEARTEVKASVINITPKTITKIPSVGGQADFAQYLQVVPGVVFTGDQGGQLYIRGGSPVQNKVLLDGMIIYNPFHSIGLFSVFDTDIIRNADVFTGGFGAEYGDRISSVMDITTRDGNKKRLAGKMGLSSFGAKLTLEGPIVKAKTPEGASSSFIVSLKNSYLEQTSKMFYTYAGDEGLPFNFFDVYGKASINSANGSKINFFGFNFSDKVNNYQSLSNFGWDSYGAGANFLVIPGKSPVLIEGNLAYSNYEASIDEKDGNPRYSGINGFNVGFNFTYFLGKNTFKYGIEMLGFSTKYNFTNGAGCVTKQDQNTTELAAYAKYKANFGKLVFDPSVRIQWYASLANVQLEPRVALKYNITDNLRLKAAGGRYSQNLIAANSDRDVVNLFYGFLSASDDVLMFNGERVQSKLQLANHYIFGIEYDLTRKITTNVEGYWKDFAQLTNVNRNKVFDPLTAPSGVSYTLTSDYMVETGDAYGVDFSLKFEDKHWYLWTVYSLAYVTKTYEKTDFGYNGITMRYNTSLASYRPHYDRRHNVNVILTYSVGDLNKWEFSGRWNFGSGFPFTQLKGIYENVSFGDGIFSDYINEAGDFGFVYGDLNEGELPTYHRLDIDAKRRFFLSENSTLEVDFSITNVYNRKNVFYVNMIYGDNDGVVYQLPFMPSLGMTLSF